MQKLPIVLMGVGLVLALGALSGWALFPAFINWKVSQKIRLVKDGETFKKWEKIPIPIYMKVYIFNLTNPDQVLKGETPVVHEIGPYVYQQTREKINVTFEEDVDKIKYKQIITYHYRPEMSNGTEEDEISMINLPFVGMAAKLMKQPSFQRFIARDAVLEHAPDESPVMRRTVNEFLFGGYHVDFIRVLSELKSEELLPNNTFGLYYGKNGTSNDWLEVFTGVQDNTKFGNIASFNGNSSLPFWNENPYCNMVNGSDGALFPPFVSKDRRLNIFSPELCRSLYLEYEGKTEIKGLVGYRFTLPKSVLEDPRKNEANRCFCTDPGNEETLEKCPKQGAYQLESCRKGAPIIVSLPHFLDGDEDYLNQTLGLHPDRSKHETVIILEPTTGVLLEAKKRIQINLDVTPSKLFPVMKKLPRTVLPIVWVDESAALTDTSAALIKSQLIKPKELAPLVAYGVFGFGCFLILIAVVIFFLRSRKKDYKPQ